MLTNSVLFSAEAYSHEATRLGYFKINVHERNGISVVRNLSLTDMNKPGLRASSEAVTKCEFEILS